MNTGNKSSTRNLNWRVFPILIAVCKVCSIFSFYGISAVPQFIAQMIVAFTMVFTRLSVTGYSWRGGRREGNFQNRRQNNSWLGYVTPKSKTNIGSDQTWPFDGQNEQSKGSGFELFEPVCTSTFCCKWTTYSASNKTRFPSGKKSMICELCNISLLSSFTRTNVFNFYMIAYPAWNAGSPRDASGHRRACSGGGVRNGFEKFADRG